jgi:hypothetical protein
MEWERLESKERMDSLVLVNNPQLNLVIITLLVGGVIMSNFLDFLEQLTKGDWVGSLRQLFNLLGISALVWIHYFQPILK